MRHSGANNLSSPVDRGRRPEATLERAKRWAKEAGIRQVYPITHLDCLEVPVFVSFRPEAQAERVTFGKGFDPLHAEVSAYMEAIEFFFAEPGRGGIATSWGSVMDVDGCAGRPEAILDFVPRLQSQVELDSPLLLATVEDLETGAPCRVPAELVFYPAPHVGQSIFGSSTNGLASGNSVEEASFHALVELIERDIWSFEFVRRTSALVDPASLPEEVRAVVRRAESGGLRLKIRTIANDYGIPFFAAFLFDPERPARRFFNGGWGCHPDRQAALKHAVAETAQSRAAFIHGGRAIPGRAPVIAKAGVEEESAVAAHIAGISDDRNQVSYSSIAGSAVGGAAKERFEALVRCLRRVCRKPVYRAMYTSPEDDLQVVRIIVPGLENFKESTPRVGPRLKAALDAGVTPVARAS